MSQQTIRQQARRAARGDGGRSGARSAGAGAPGDSPGRASHGRASAARDAAVAETEKRAGEALLESTAREGLSLCEAVEWCGETVTVREGNAAAAARR